MDHETIYTSILPRITQSPCLTTFSEIMDQIRSEKYRDAIDQIQNAPEEERQEKKREQLPAFFPTLRLGDNNTLDDDAIPTGVIQFDLDLKDNPEIDLQSIREEIKRIPELLYVFTSPSGGLKFGFLTDFNRYHDEILDSLKARYKCAYQIALKYLYSQLSKQVELDPAIGNIKYACYLSFDEDVYYNPKSARLILDADCIYNPPPIISYDYDQVDRNHIAELLAFIPRTLSYDKRLPINLAVMSAIGIDALPLLESHWTTDAPSKLKKDLGNQFASLQAGKSQGYLSALYKTAKEHGYKSVTGSSRKLLKPKVVDQTFEPLLSPLEAESKLKSIVADFFKDGKPRFINFSTGAGKTQTLLNVLEGIHPEKNVLYLVKTHDLAEEIIASFKKIRSNANQSRGFRELASRSSHMDHLQGRNRLCEDTIIKSQYEKAKLSIPTDYCTQGCLFEAECAYTLQFNNPHGNIRVMTHNEYFNQSSKWFSGQDALGRPRKNQWQPNYLIIDENVLEKAEDLIESGSRFQSIERIIADMKNGQSLSRAILDNKDALILDNDSNKRPYKPRFDLEKDFIQAIKEWEKQLKKYSPLLDNLVKFAITEEPAYLWGLRLVNKNLVQSRMKLQAERHHNIPVLYLDATADLNIIEQVLPDVEFHSIHVQAKSDINLYQLANKSITKEFLKEEKNLDTIIAGLKVLVAKYHNPGLITYKRLSENDKEDFDVMLAHELGITLSGHFGNLRGINKFEDVDCLIILGRYCVNVKAIPSYVWAVFNEDLELGRVYGDSLVRMKDGSVQSINTLIHTDPHTQAIYEHFSLSETKQAIGRGRLVHGSPKHIFYLCNECLGSDIAVTDFRYYDDLFPKQILSKTTLNSLIERGFLKDKQADYKRLGFSKKQVQTHRKQIGNELESVGFKRFKIEIKKSSGKVSSSTYWVKNIEALEADLVASGSKLLSTIALD